MEGGSGVYYANDTQTRDTMALQLKLDELIIATKNARNSMAGIENSTDEVLEAVKEESRQCADSTASKAPTAV